MADRNDFATAVGGLIAERSKVVILPTMSEARAWEVAHPGSTALSLAPWEPSSYGAAVLADHPAVYLPLDDPAGAGTARNHGTAGGEWTVAGGSLGAPGIGDAPTGYMINDSATDAIVGPSPYFKATQPWSAELIVSPVDIVGESRMLLGVGKAAWALGYHGSPSNRTFFGYQGGDYTPGVLWAPPPFTQHVAMTYDGTRLRVYRNGVLFSSLVTSTPIGAGGVARVGGVSGFAGLRGTYAGVALYPGVALPVERVLAHAQAGGFTP